jgi:hypothetical protein
MVISTTNKGAKMRKQAAIGTACVPDASAQTVPAGYQLFEEINGDLNGDRHANANLSLPFELVTIFEGKQDFQNIHHRIAHNFTFTFQQRRQNYEKQSLIQS